MQIVSIGENSVHEITKLFFVVVVVVVVFLCVCVWGGGGGGGIRNVFQYAICRLLKVSHSKLSVNNTYFYGQK